MACMRKFASLPSLSVWKNARWISSQAGQSLWASTKSTDVTHTGQVFDKDDYRNARFENAARIVNKSWAIDLIAEEPIIKSKDRVVYCTGGDEHLGHPKVYINLDKPGAHSCGYCGLRYEKEDHHH